MTLVNYTVKVFNFGLASRLYYCTIPNGCIWVRHTTKITPHYMDPTKSFMFLVSEWIITLPKWQDYWHFSNKKKLSPIWKPIYFLLQYLRAGAPFPTYLYMERFTFPVTNILYLQKITPNLFTIKYEAFDVSVLPIPKMI